VANKIKYLLILCISLGALTLLLFNESKYFLNTRQQVEESFAKTQEIIIDKDRQFRKITESDLRDTINLERKLNEFLDLYSKENIILFVYKNDTNILWTDNSVNVQRYLPALNSGTHFINTANGAYLTRYKALGSYKFVLFYLIKSSYSYQNQYIENHFNNDLKFLGSALLSPSHIKDFFDVVDKDNNYLFSIQIFGEEKSIPWLLKIGIILTLFLALWAFNFLIGRVIKQRFYLGSLLFLGFTFGLRALLLKFKVPFFLYSLKLFNPEIYASSNLIPSLGDFIVAVAILLWYVIIIGNTENGRIARAENYNKLRFFIISLLTITLADSCFDAIKSLVYDSQISFDLKNVYSLNIYTFLGLALSVMLLLVEFFIVRKFYHYIASQLDRLKVNLVIIGIAFYFVHPFLVNYLFERNDYYPIASSSLIMAFLLYNRYVKITTNRFQQYFALAFLLSFFTALSINYWSVKEEEETRKLMANKLVSQNDITTEYFLKSVEKKIFDDKQIRFYFINPIGLKSQFEKRLRQLYFTGYLSKYDLSVFDFDSTGNHFRMRNPYSYRQLEYAYKNLSNETINAHFRYLKNNAFLQGYLGRFEIKQAHKTLGYIYLLIQPKLIQDENRFDELLIDGFKSAPKNKLDYSYAIYRDKILISQSGIYPYRTTNIWMQGSEKYNFFDEENFNHLLLDENAQISVVVSKKSETIYEAIGLFSLVFTFFTVLMIIALILYSAVNSRLIKRRKIFSYYPFKLIRKFINNLLIIKDNDVVYIRTRIQVSIILIVFLTLCVTAYFSISFIVVKYNEKQVDKLMKKLKSVVSTIEAEAQYTLSDLNKSEAEGFTNQIADYYSTDITLFSPEGEVVTSTINKIYESGIIAPLMNSAAYYHLSKLRESQYIHSEKIATFSFTAAYVPVFNKNSILLGYVQLPYFSKQAELYAEISSLIVGFINLYALLFIIIAVIAYLVSRNISYPLTMLQKQMALTTLSRKNEPIRWSRNDEIGELVQQYNLMINELENSVAKLAKSEREGAWRDIARQIAHEIKNPLTPMKLSIQHLQRAHNDNSPKLDETIKRVSKTLVSQIDTLSELAEEFSSYAKMPTPRFEQINLNSTVVHCVDLFGHDYTGKFDVAIDNNIEVYFDANFLNRTIGNIIKNAIQAMPENHDGVIGISALIEDGMAIIRITDNGIGIEEDKKKEIFTPYFSTKITGMGLGLPIVKSMLETAGGSIEFESQLGVGTTFIIKVPLSTDE